MYFHIQVSCTQGKFVEVNLPAKCVCIDYNSGRPLTNSFPKCFYYNPSYHNRDRSRENLPQKAEKLNIFFKNLSNGIAQESKNLELCNHLVPLQTPGDRKLMEVIISTLQQFVFLDSSHSHQIHLHIYMYTQTFICVFLLWLFEIYWP